MARHVVASGSRTLGEEALLLASAVVALASLALAAAVHAGMAVGIPTGWRAAIAVSAATLLPGVPTVVVLRPASRAVGMALATSTSWAVAILLAQTTLVARWWHPLIVTSAIDTLSLVLCAVALAVLRPGSSSPRTRLRRAWVAGRRWSGSRALPLTSLAVALVLFVVQAATIDLDGLGPFGLITAVRWPYVLSLVLIGLVWAAGLGPTRVDHALLACTSIVLTIVTTSLVSASDGRSSVPTGFVHREFIDLIVSLRHLPPPIDARFDWAGFFAGSAQVVSAAGLHDATALMSPAPILAGVLMIAPLYVIGRAVTGRARTAWLAVLLYQLTNWYQQDYFAPQMVAQLWYVTITAVLLWWWRAGRERPHAGRPYRRVLAALRSVPARPALVGAGRALGTEGLLVLLCATMVLTHQLTPIALIAVLLAFTVTGSTRFRWIWLSTVVAFTAWFSFGAEDYWAGHLASLLGDLGQVGGSVSGGVGARVGALPSREIGQGLRIASSGGLGVLALIGWARRFRRPGWVLSGALAGIPFGLVAVQSYGGEVVIRCFLLATPVLAPLAADLLVAASAVLASAWQRRGPRRWRRPPRAASVAVVASFVVTGSLLLTLTRGLNASFERTTVRQDEVGLALLDAVPEGTRIVPLGISAWMGDSRVLHEVTVGFTASDGADCVQEFIACTERVDPEFVVATPEMDAQGRYMLGEPAGWLERGERRLVERDGYVVAYRTQDLVILRRADVTMPAGVS